MSKKKFVSEYISERILDVNNPVKSKGKSGYKNNFWNYEGYFHFTDSKDIREEIPKEFIDKINRKFSRFLKQKVDTGEYHERNPALTIVYDAYRIEARKRFISELGDVQSQLEDMLDKPHSKRRGKDIKSRIKNLQRVIDTNTEGTKVVFLTDDEVTEHRRKKNIDARVFEYTTIGPILGFSQKYDKALDLLENLGVPNIELFRGIEKGTKEYFLKEGGNAHFLPGATAYLATHGAEALEDVVRRIPIESSSQSYMGTRNADLKQIANTKEMQDKIKELGLPQKETTIFLREARNASDIEGLRNFIIRNARSFYRNQLNHKDELLQWAGVRALADSRHIPDVYSAVNLKRASRIRKRKQKREFSKFKAHDLPLIYTSLNIYNRFPNIAKSPETLANRFLKTELWDFPSIDSYDLTSLDYIAKTIPSLNKILEKYDIAMSTEDFVNQRELNNPREGIKWIVENLETEDYKGLSDNQHFNNIVNERNIRELLKDNYRNVPKYFSLLKDIAKKIESASKDLNEEQTDLVYDAILDNWKGITRGDEDYILTFIDVIARQKLKTEKDVHSCLSNMGYFSKLISGLDKSIQVKLLKDYDKWYEIQNNPEFSEFLNEKIMKYEILPLATKPSIVKKLLKNKYAPTPRLIQMCEISKNNKTLMKLLQKKRNEIKKENFSLDDQIMIDVEYSKYRRTISQFSKEPENYTYYKYIETFSENKRNREIPEWRVRNISYLCYEAKLLLDELRIIKKRGEEQGRETLITPNFSYGMVAMLAIIDTLEKEGFKIFPAKIGSSECHDNKSYVKNQLFQNGTNKYILTKQPNIVVVDGTSNTQANPETKEMRYPDSHIGYLNFMIIINDIITGKNEELYIDNYHMTKRSVRSVRHSHGYDEEKNFIISQVNGNIRLGTKPYMVDFWNPLGYNARTKNYFYNDEDKNRVSKEEMMKRNLPLMVIANTTHSETTIPEDIKSKFGEYSAAAFDDDIDATEMNFKSTPNGIVYENKLSGIIKDRFNELFEK